MSYQELIQETMQKLECYASNQHIGYDLENHIIKISSGLRI